VEWRVNVECALLVKSLSNFLYSNWWLRYITNKQTRITNSSLPRQIVYRGHREILWNDQCYEKGRHLLEMGCDHADWIDLFRNGLVTGSTILLEKLMCSAAPEIPCILLNSAVHYHIQRILNEDITKC